MEDEPWLETDPFKEKVDSLQGAHPGMKFHMLSRKVIDKRGKRGWEILKDAKGDPEAVGGMLVGVMPEQTAKRRNKKFQAIGNDAVKEADEAYQTQQEKIIGDGKRAGLSALRPGEVVQDSERPERAVHTGLHTQRG
jgi:stage V sporulation protein SpoVS